MTLTTPVTASEPYDADAPPVTVSMRSMITDGMKFKSTPPPWFVATWRIESTSVNVRVPKYGFKPRRFAIVVPTKNEPLPVVAA